MNYGFIELKNCHSLRIDLFTDRPELHALVRSMLDRLSESLKGKRVPRGQITGLEFYQIIKLIFENFIFAKLHPFSLSLSNDYYAKMPKRYNPQGVTAYKLRSAMKWLEANRFIVIHKGVFTKKLCVRTRLEPTKELKKLLRETGLKKGEITINEKAERLVLKDKSEDNRKIYVDYEDTEETHRLRNFILSYERFINKHKFASAEGPITKLTFKRVFNNASFEQGGRFYSEYQNIKSAIRSQTMTCNGVPMKEWDFKGMHINMLYAKKGLPYPKEDVYTVSGFEEYRDLFKIALQIALNASTPGKAVLGMNRHLIQNKIDLKKINGRIVLEAFAKKHAPIKEYFFSGIGVNLQYLDSQICERIMQDGLENNIPILTVHDSFLVTEGNEEFLTGLMKKYSQEFLGRALQTEAK